MKTTLHINRTTLRWDEDTTSELPVGTKITRSIVECRLDGDIAGTSILDYAMVYVRPDLAHFRGYELISGTYGGHPGSIVLLHEGTYSQTGVDIEVTVVPESGKGSLAWLGGPAGRGRIQAEPTDSMRSVLSLSPGEPAQ